MEVATKRNGSRNDFSFARLPDNQFDRASNEPEKEPRLVFIPIYRSLGCILWCAESSKSYYCHSSKITKVIPG